MVVKSLGGLDWEPGYANINWYPSLVSVVEIKQ